MLGIGPIRVAFGTFGAYAPSLTLPLCVTFARKCLGIFQRQGPLGTLGRLSSRGWYSSV
jgi:hypothetical protein